MKEFFKSRAFKVLLCIALILCGVMLNSILRYGVAGTVDGISGVIVTPLQKAVTSVGDFFSGLFGGISNSDEANAKIKELEEQNAELLNKVADYDEIKRENEQMKDLIGLIEENPETTYVLSEVTSRGKDVWSHSITIDMGSLDGVNVGDPVITKDNFLVGTVTKVGLTWATVSTVYDSSTNIGAFLSSTRDAGVLESSKTGELEGYCSLNFLPTDCGAGKGDIVLTSGLGGAYPKGIIIGLVESSELSADGLTMTAKITPSADIDKIKDVFVITSWRGEEDRAED